MRSRAAVRLSLFVLLMLVVVCAQTSSIASLHFHEHSSPQHCCGLCHAGSLAFLQPSIATALAPALMPAWVELPYGPGGPGEVLLATGFSRAPPA